MQHCIALLRIFTSQSDSIMGSFLALIDIIIITFSYLDWISNIIVSINCALHHQWLLLSTWMATMIFYHAFGSFLVQNRRLFLEGKCCMYYFCPSFFFYFTPHTKYAEIPTYSETNHFQSAVETQLNHKLFGFIIIDGILLTLPMELVQIGVLSTNDHSLLLQISIVIGMFSLCSKTVIITCICSINWETLVFNWLCSSCDLFLFLTKIIFIAVYHPSLYIYYLCEVIIVFPIAVIATIAATRHRDGRYTFCCRWDLYPQICLFVIVDGICALIVFECITFSILLYCIYLIGYYRLPDKDAVYKFYRTVYEWVMEAKKYDEDILSISREQDKVIRLGCFHKHLSFFIKNETFKRYVIGKGEQTGFMDVEMKAFRIDYWSFFRELYAQLWEDPLLSGCKENCWCISKMIVPVYLAGRVVHILWPFYILMIVGNGMSYFEWILWGITVLLMCLTMIALYFVMIDGFYSFLLHLFPSEEELPKLYLAWRYFDAIPDVYDLTLSIPARNALLENTFGRDVALVILEYLSALDDEMPPGPGGY
eukprot:993302_1